MRRYREGTIPATTPQLRHTGDSITWYFLVVIWVPLYVLLYWAPYWVRASR